MDIHNVKPLRILHDPPCDGHRKKQGLESFRSRRPIENVVEKPAFHLVAPLLELSRMVQHDSRGACFSLSWHANRNQYPQLSPSRDQASLNKFGVPQGCLIGTFFSPCARQQILET